MSSTEAQNNQESENLCVVCFKNVEIYSIGVCDHPVCFECSTRMRVLCKQTECPICRGDMPKVIFTKTIEHFYDLFPKYERSNLQDRKFGLFFCTMDIQKAYNQLLKHRCHICEENERNFSFPNFNQLKDHMRRQHELFYCDICAENLKIFSFERRSYNRQELGLHRRKGDVDNKSHKGHPLCEFCDVRFMDKDDLFVHLRRTHLFCHFCDADGKHQYYNNMEDLMRHFRDEHYLCEEGGCKEMPLTAVFRTDIDLKAHISMEHSRNMSKSASKQNRTLEVEFTLAPRPRVENRNGRYANRRDRYDDDNDPGGMENSEPEPPSYVNPLTSANFPALGNSTVTIQRPLPQVNFTSKFNGTHNYSDFPTLGGGSSRAPAVTITTNTSRNSNHRAPEVTITKTVRNNQNQPSKNNNNNFPALGGPKSAPASSSGSSTVRLSLNNSQNPKVSIQVNHKPNLAITTHISTSSSQNKSTEAFPALGSSKPVVPAQWVQSKPKKTTESRLQKVAAAPQLPPSDISQFPSLSKAKKGKKTSSVTMPVSGNYSSQTTEASTSKKNSKSEEKPAKSEEKPAKSELDKKLEQIKLHETSEHIKKQTKKKKLKPENTEVPVTPKNNNLREESNNNKNEKVKKRSELKIGTLKTNGETSNIKNSKNTEDYPSFDNKKQDFPSIDKKKEEHRSVDSKKQEYPNLDNKKQAPPGFGVKPPPGFNSSSFPALGGNDLTFTNSTGQSYSILPETTYRQPSNFSQRNQNLIKRFKAVLNDNEAISEFKTYSELFRKGAYPAEKYFDHCKVFLGLNFDEVFPELLVLLPDISKQQELFEFLSGKSKKLLVTCENCRQVIFKRELKEHYDYHTLDNTFPSLGKAQQVNNSAWKK